MRPFVAIVWMGVLGCEVSPPPQDPFTEAASTSEAEDAMVVDGALAGMPQPGTRATLSQDLSFLQGQGVDLVVSANHQAIDPAVAAGYGIDHVHLPVEDFQAPTLDQMNRFVDLAHERIANGERVAVHCTAGMGRTGTFLAVWFVADGMGPAQAIAHVREKRPGSIESASQEEAIRTFWASRLDVSGTP